jgi:hypothetical protein
VSSDDGAVVVALRAGPFGAFDEDVGRIFLVLALGGRDPWGARDLGAPVADGGGEPFLLGGEAATGPFAVGGGVVPGDEGRADGGPLRLGEVLDGVVVAERVWAAGARRWSRGPSGGRSGRMPGPLRRAWRRRRARCARGSTSRERAGSRPAGPPGWSVAPTGLFFRSLADPTACAVGYFLSPLRGWGRARGAAVRRGGEAREGTGRRLGRSLALPRAVVVQGIRVVARASSPAWVGGWVRRSGGDQCRAGGV